MKITIIGPSYPYRGGIALFSNRLAEALKEDANDVNIVTYKLQYPSFLFPGKTQYAVLKNEKTVNTVRAINSVNPFNWIKVGRQIRKENPDLVIFKYWMPFMAPCFGSISRVLKKNNKTKIITIVHNLLPHERHLGDKWLAKFFLKKSDGFITMSNVVFEQVNELVKPEKPKLFSPHPLYDNFGEIKTREEALKSLNLENTPRYMLFFGIVRKYKGLDLLLKAFANKQLNDGSIKLIIAGEFYDDASYYYELIEKHNLTNNVILKSEFIPDGEVVNYFCASDIIVQPYKNATQSGVTQIAYHFEKPMLVTNVGGLREIVPHNKVGYVVQPKEEEIVEALIDFFQKERLVEFTDGVKEEKKKYSWQKMVDTIYDLFDRIS